MAMKENICSCNSLVERSLLVLLLQLIIDKMLSALQTNKENYDLQLKRLQQIKSRVFKLVPFP